jgi:amidohydrolase
MNETISYIDAQSDKILETFKDLHELAEPSWKEEKTSKYIQEKLVSAGLKVRNFNGHHGFTVDLKGEKKEVIAIRADMDALVQEVDGVVQANHSCGHDAHSTMVLFSALTLARKNHQHTIRFIFQPAEEMAEGALTMLEDGALENVKFLGGIHLRPAFEVPFGKATPVIWHGSTASIKGSIYGTPAHAARPEDGKNPIETAALLIQAIRQIRMKGDLGYSIKMTELHSGEASNLIPATARFTLDIRAKSNGTMEQLLEKTKHTITKVAELTETEIDYSVGSYSPAAVKNDKAVELASNSIISVLGEANLIPVCQSPGAEDFHFYTFKKPEIAATMVGLGCNLQPGLHHPKMRFNHESLIYGTKILTELMLKADEENW